MHDCIHGEEFSESNYYPSEKNLHNNTYFDEFMSVERLQLTPHY